MQADDAMRILGSAAAMGLLGGGGALAYNATTKPILDEYGNVIESNDINPVMAALGSAAIGAVGSGIYGKMNPASIPIPEEHLGSFRTQTKPVRQVRLQKEIDDLRDEIAITRQGIDEYKKNRKVPEVRQPQPQQSPVIIEPEVMPTQGMPIQESVAEQKRYVPQLSSEQEALYAEAKRLGISPYELEERGWKYNPNQPTVQVVPASPMQMQNPMTPPGMRTVVIQPMKEPGQESADELMALQNLAGLQGNPPNLVNEYFDPSLNVRTFVQDVYSPEEKYLYSQIGQKQYQNPDKLPRLIQQPVRPGQEEFITTRRQVAGNAPGWNVVSADPEAAAYSKELGERQRPQNLQPVEPGQEMIEEALRLKELARRQAHFKGFDYPHNPEPWNYNQSSYSPSPSLHLVDGNPYDPNPEAFNSRKLLASQWNVYGPSSSQQAMESEKWLRKQGFATYEDYLAQKKRA